MGQKEPVKELKHLIQAPVTKITHAVLSTYCGGNLLYINIATNVIGTYVALKISLHISTLNVETP